MTRYRGIPAWLARPLLSAAVGAVLVSGCSCEGPTRRPAPAAGREPPLVRVRLGDDAPAAAVAVTGPWRLMAAGAEAASGEILDWTDVAAQAGGIRFGDQVPAAGPLELHPTEDGSIWVRQTVGGRQRDRCYRGFLRIITTGAGTLRVVNVVPMEDYLAGVLANELLKPWNPEAYKAQCVVARTYALTCLAGRNRDCDVCDSTFSQVYGGAASETQRAWDAVTATWGIVATYRDSRGKAVLLPTYYHSTCGGATVPAGSVFGGPTPAPLAGVPCTYCRNSPKYRWPEVVLTKQEIGEALKRSGYTAAVRLGPVARVEVAATTGEGGRAETIRVVDAAGSSVLLQAPYWRGLVGASRIPSTWFDIEDRGAAVALTGGRGYGHGVGLCQWGAEYLAERGKTGEEILRYYYPKVELAKAY
jgi:stage II sporulation protein D